ncbi:hypothetical protein D9M71_458210 [compost metagenome]
MLATGEATRVSVLLARQADLGQELLTQGNGVGMWGLLDHDRAFDDVFQGGAMGEQVEVLEHETYVLAQTPHQALLLVQGTAGIDLDIADLDPAAGGFFQKIQAAQEGGLARTARADDRDHLAFLDLKIDAIEHDLTLELLCQFFHDNHWVRTPGRAD